MSNGNVNALELLPALNDFELKATTRNKTVWWEALPAANLKHCRVLPDRWKALWVQTGASRVAPPKHTGTSWHSLKKFGDLYAAVLTLKDVMEKELKTKAEP